MAGFAHCANPSSWHEEAPLQKNSSWANETQDGLAGEGTGGQYGGRGMLHGNRANIQRQRVPVAGLK